jgi:hypothetical protein
MNNARQVPLIEHPFTFTINLSLNNEEMYSHMTIYLYLGIDWSNYYFYYNNVILITFIN